MKFIVEEFRAGEPSWWLVDDADQPLAWAGVTFTSIGAADHAAHDFRHNAATAEYQVHEESDGSWRWTAWCSAASCVATSGQAFPSKEDAAKAAEDVLERAGRAIGP